MTNKEITAELFLTENSVKTYCTRIYSKLGVHTRAGAAAKAITDGLIQDQVPLLDFWALPPRRMEVAAYVAQGLENSEIATWMGIEERTVISHLQLILTDLGLSRGDRALIAAAYAKFQLFTY